MSERYGGGWGELPQSIGDHQGVERAAHDLKGYRERQVESMIGPALVTLADAYERRAQESGNPEDLAQEILCRVEAATHLSGDSSRRIEAWQQRYHALSDLLDETGEPKSFFANHLKLMALSLPRVRDAMLDFEMTMDSDRTSFGARRYSDEQVRDVMLGNRELGIGGGGISSVGPSSVGV